MIYCTEMSHDKTLGNPYPAIDYANLKGAL